MCHHLRITQRDMHKFAEFPGFHEDFPKEIREDTLAPCIVLSNGRYVIKAMSFGFDIAEKKVLNCRIETADTKDFFSSSFENRRTLLFCSSFLETGKDKEEYEFSTGTVIYLAGIYKNGEFVLLTKEGEGEPGKYCRRMPIYVPRELAEDYLNGASKKRIIEYKQPDYKIESRSDQMSLF